MITLAFTTAEWALLIAVVTAAVVVALLIARRL